MTKQRRHFDGPQKVAILKRHLLTRSPEHGQVRGKLLGAVLAGPSAIGLGVVLRDPPSTQEGRKGRAE